MKRGAVAVLDALGFKGIWGRSGVDSDVVLENLRRLADNVEAGLKALAERMGAADQVRVVSNTELIAFSDSIILLTAAELKEQLPASEQDAQLIRDFVALQGTCYAASTIIVGGAILNPPLVYRGALSFGEFSRADRFAIGPAVDEAASMESLAEAAIVWLTPSALHVAEHLPQEYLPAVVDSPVPLKGGNTFRTTVVNPLAVCQEYSQTVEPRTVVERTLNWMRSEREIGVAVKSQNTEAFFRVAETLVMGPQFSSG